MEGGGDLPWSPQQRRVTALWGSKPGDLYVGGSVDTEANGRTYARMLLHGDGFTMNAVTLPLQPGSIQTIAGSGPNDVWCGGGSGVESLPGDDQAGRLLHFDGASWTETSTVPVKAFAARAPNDLYAFGGADAVHYDGHAWRPVTLPIPKTAIVLDAWATAEGDVWVLANDGELLTLDGGAFVAAPLGAASGPLAAAIADAPDHVRGLAARRHARLRHPAGLDLGHRSGGRLGARR